MDVKPSVEGTWRDHTTHRPINFYGPQSYLWRAETGVVLNLCTGRLYEELAYEWQPPPPKRGAVSVTPPILNFWTQSYVWISYCLNADCSYWMLVLIQYVKIISTATFHQFTQQRKLTPERRGDLSVGGGDGGPRWSVFDGGGQTIWWAKSRMRINETRHPIWMKFCRTVDIHDVIMYITWGVARGLISAFPIDFDRRP